MFKASARIERRSNAVYRSSLPRGEVIAVKARIRLLRSFDEISHQYQGYTLVIVNTDSEGEVLRVAIGPAAHSKHQFRIGDLVSGKAQPVPIPHEEWANLYKASGLKVERRGPAEQDRPADPVVGIAPSLEAYRTNGHRRLDPHTCQVQCQRCPWGLTMATEIIIDHWNPSKKRWRMETHCYGPTGTARDIALEHPGRFRAASPGWCGLTTRLSARWESKNWYLQVDQSEADLDGPVYSPHALAG